MRNIYVIDKNLNSLDGKTKKRRALILSQSEWLKIEDHLTKDQKWCEAAEKKRAEEERKKQLSKEMAKTWDNTILNMRKRRLELRKERQDKLEQDRQKQYLQARQEEEDFKMKVSEEAKAILWRERDSTKELLSSLRFSEVLRERAEQIKFDSKLKRIELDKEKIYEDKIKEDVKKYEEEIQEQNTKMSEKKKKLAVAAQEQFREYFEKKQTEQEQRINLEREDNINTQKEIEMEKENAQKEIERKKKIIRDDVIQNRKMIEDFSKQKQLEDEEEDNAIKIHAATKKRIAAIRKHKEIELRVNAQERRKKISSLISNEEGVRNAKEENMLRKAIAEKEKLEEDDKQMKNEYKERLINELQEERKNFLEREEAKKIKEHEELKWDMMQRFKQEEENDKFFKQAQMGRTQTMHENRQYWDKQCNEKALQAAEEREQDINAVRQAVEWWDMEDKKFIEYSEKLIEDSKKKGRLLLPIVRTLEKYKKQINLNRPKYPEQHKMFKSNVPIDSFRNPHPRGKHNMDITSPVLKPAEKYRHGNKKLVQSDVKEETGVNNCFSPCNGNLCIRRK